MRNGKLHENDSVFPYGNTLKPYPSLASVVACTECHVVYAGEKSLKITVDRYDGKEPISGWIICSSCRARTV